MEITINYLAVLVCGVVAMVLGGVWYGPLFGKKWMEGMGWDSNNQALMAEKKKAAGPAYAQMFVLALVQAYVLARLAPSIQGGLWLWLGLILPVKYGDKLWGGKKMQYVGIDLAYYLVLLCVMGLILSVWK